MAREQSGRTDQADPPENPQTKVILNAISELQQAVAALSNGLIEFSGRFDKRFPSTSMYHGVHTADMIRAERILPLIQKVMRGNVFSCVSLVNAVMATQHEELAMEIDEFQNNKRLGNFFARIAGHAIENGLVVKRITSPGAIPQLWMVQLIERA